MKLNFGKHKGQDISEVEDSYLLWILQNHEDFILLEVAEMEMKKRGYPKISDLEDSIEFDREDTEIDYFSSF